MKLLKSIRTLIVGTPESRPVKITLTRNCQVRLVSGEMVGGETGKTYTVTAASAAQLESIGSCEIEVAGEESAALSNRSNFLQSLLPAPREAAPVPAEWQSLPNCFRQWWELDERFCLARGRRDDLQVAFWKRAGLSAKGEGLGLITVFAGGIPNYNDRETLLQRWSNPDSGIPVASDEVMVRDYLHDALTRAEKAIADLTEAEGDNLFRLHIACSDHLIETHSTLSRTCKDLAQAGFDLFSLRIQSLGLSEAKVRSLFGGSADSMKYELPAELPTLQDVRLLWNDQDGKDQKHFVAISPASMVQLVFQWQARDKELGKLLGLAKAELAKAKKASMPAGLPA